MPQESEDLKKAVETKKIRVNAAEAAYQKEYDKLAEQAKHETEEEARLEREEAQRQAELEKLNTPAPQAQAPVVPQESGSSVGDFIAGILAIVTGALTLMSIGTTANTFLKNNGLPHF